MHWITILIQIRRLDPLNDGIFTCRPPSNIVDVAVSNNIVGIALSNNELMRLDLANPSEIDRKCAWKPFDIKCYCFPKV